MRIFPEGTEEWLEPAGKVFLILSAFAVVIGFVWFLRQEYVLHTWRSTDGVVVESKLLTSEDENGATSCSAAYRVKYYVGAT